MFSELKKQVKPATLGGEFLATQNKKQLLN
jgi:hypothetical protein